MLVDRCKGGPAWSFGERYVSLFAYRGVWPASRLWKNHAILQIHSSSCLPKIWYARYSTLTRIDGMIVDWLTKKTS
jgi:hypothetical protein